MPNKFVVITSDSTNEMKTATVSELLRHARALLEMDIVFVSEFLDGRRFFRHVDAGEDSLSLIEEGQSNPLEETYCQRIVDGRLPLAIPDTHLLPEANNLNVTKALNIRAYLATPITSPDGQVMGTICCISHKSRTALGSREIDSLRSIARRIAVDLQKDS